MKVQQALGAHFPQLQRQAAALHRKIIRQLPREKGTSNSYAPQPLGLGGKVGHELGPCGALAHMVSFSPKRRFFFRASSPQQVADDPAVVRAGGGADVQDALDVQKRT